MSWPNIAARVRWVVFMLLPPWYDLLPGGVMSQVSQLIATLKNTLKTRGITYRDVAAGLVLSEASVKRMFAAESFSLQRLERVCELAGMQLTDLTRLMEQTPQSTFQLTEAQELELVSDLRLFLVGFLAVSGFRFQEILQSYTFTEAELIGCIARLERMRVLELLPNNRIKRLVSPKSLVWRPGGPIQRFFVESVLGEFLHSAFATGDESLDFLYGHLSEVSAQRLRDRVDRLVKEFRELDRSDLELSLGQRRGYAMLTALRPFLPSAFRPFERDR